jgi:hypothetical protein
LEGSGEVNNRICVTERGRQVILSPERSNLVGQLIETPPERGTYLSAYPGHGHGTSSPSHAHRLPDLSPIRHEARCDCFSLEGRIGA